MVDGKNKTIFMVAGGIAALALGYLAMKCLGDDEGSSSRPAEITDADLEKAGIDKVERSGQLLENRYFLRLL